MDISYVNDISVEDFNFLRESVGWSVFDKDLAYKGLQNSVYKIAAILNGKTIAFARVISDGGLVAFIADVMVLPEHQGKGIGTEIMNRVMDYIKDSLTVEQRLSVNLMAAKGKDDFYLQFGFNKRPSDNYGCGMTQVLFAEG